MMAKAQAESLLKSVGFSIDWSKITWANVWAVMQALLAMFIAQPAPSPSPSPVIKGNAKCDPGTCDCLKAHFDCITAISQCGSQCCSGQVPC